MDKRLVEAINLQIKYEFFSAQLYFAMASYCKENDFDGFESWFFVQNQEEQFHTMKFYNYINERGEKALITGFEDPKRDYESLEDVFEYGLEHEKTVSQRINKLMDVAHEVKDYAAIQFLQWFINEQVEEEDSFRSMLAKIKLVGEKGEGIYHLDKEASARVFVAPAN